MIESSSISVTSIGTNPYAPTGSDAVNLYSANGATDLTFGQLLSSITVRLASVYEQRSVLVMNNMTRTNDLIEAMSSVMEQIVNGDSTLSYTDEADVGDSYEARTETFKKTPTIKNFLIYECGIDSTSLPSDGLSSYDNQMSVYKLLKTQMDNQTSKAQDYEITLKSCITRRDVAYSTSTSASKRYQSSLLTEANNL